AARSHPQQGCRSVPLSLPVLRFQSFRSKSQQSSLSYRCSLFKNFVLRSKQRLKECPITPFGRLLKQKAARRRFRFQFFDFNRFGPNHAKVLFHWYFLFSKKLRCKNKTGCKKAECPLAARLTWPREHTHVYCVSSGGVSLEALRRRLSAVLPLS